jgi:uncharacterized protein (TIGR02466 family)
VIDYGTIESHTILPYLMAESHDNNFGEIKNDFVDWMHNYSKVYQQNYRSNVNGYQSPDDFYKEESFTLLLNYMSERILDLLDVYKESEECAIECTPRLSNMWFNINYKGSYNTIHTHPGSILGGVLYINVPENSGDICFHHQDGHSLSLIQNTSFSITPHDGLMLLFPASLSHGVGMNYSDEPRFSIAFNLYEFYE